MLSIKKLMMWLSKWMILKKNIQKGQKRIVSLEKHSSLIPHRRYEIKWLPSGNRKKLDFSKGFLRAQRKNPHMAYLRMLISPKDTIQRILIGKIYLLLVHRKSGEE